MGLGSKTEREKQRPDKTVMPSSALRGIILIMASMTIAAFAGAIMKLLGEQIPAYLVAWFRFLGMSLLLMALIA